MTGGPDDEQEEAAEAVGLYGVVDMEPPGLYGLVCSSGSDSDASSASEGYSSARSEAEE